MRRYNSAEYLPRQQASHMIRLSILHKIRSPPPNPVPPLWGYLHIALQINSTRYDSTEKLSRQQAASQVQLTAWFTNQINPTLPMRPRNITPTRRKSSGWHQQASQVTLTTWEQGCGGGGGCYDMLHFYFWAWVTRTSDSPPHGQKYFTGCFRRKRSLCYSVPGSYRQVELRENSRPERDSPPRGQKYFRKNAFGAQRGFCHSIASSYRQQKLHENLKGQKGTGESLARVTPKPLPN